MTPEEILAQQIIQLADAKDKLHLLITGRQSVEVVADGYLVKYTRATIAELRAYISDLEALVNGSGRSLTGAVGVIW